MSEPVPQSVGMICLNRKQVRAIDHLALENYGVPEMVLMENAARSAVDVAVEMMKKIAAPRATILCGPGNNGGDGFAIARHLHNLGWTLQILRVGKSSNANPQSGAAINKAILEKMGYAAEYYMDDKLTGFQPNLVIDAIYGTGFRQPMPMDVQMLIGSVCFFKTMVPFQILAIDIPSGLDCDTGIAASAGIFADRTITFVAEKIGFANPASRRYTGAITVGDIGCPKELIAQVLQS